MRKTQNKIVGVLSIHWIMAIILLFASGISTVVQLLGYTTKETLVRVVREPFRSKRDVTLGNLWIRSIGSIKSLVHIRQMNRNYEDTIRI